MKAEIFNYQEWVGECIPCVLESFYEYLLKKSGFTIVKQIKHFFDPIGYTTIYLLAESHLAIHTFPEENKTYIELSSCVKSYFIKFKDLHKVSIDSGLI